MTAEGLLVERRLAMETHGRWLGNGEMPSFGWLSTPAGAECQSGVLVLPAVGYPWWSTYHTLRVLAERLAGAGHAVLRLHYHGSGNAVGSQWEGERWAAWQRSVRQGADELRGLGCERLTVVGVALGGSLGLGMATDIGASGVVAWCPVLSGRREARGLKMRSLAVPDEHAAAGTVSFAGTIFGPELLAEIADIDLLALTACPARVLLVDSPGAEALSEHLSMLGASVECRDGADGEQALTMPTEEAVAATQVVDAIADWIGTTAPTPASDRPRAPASIEFAWGDCGVREEIVRIGAHRLVGIMTSPASRPACPGTVVLLNSGSEPHVGPGYVWVELARDLAIHGYRVLRVDYRGWGESPDDGYAPGRPYDEHSIADTLEILRALDERDGEPVTLVGLCAGAWIALKATLEQPAHAVIALNPQLYWQRNDPFFALPADARAWRTPQRLEEEEGRRSGRWDALDRAGERNPASVWLDQLADSPTHVSLIFAEADMGLGYLHNRLARRLAEVTTTGGICVREIPGIDHPMHRAWLRPNMFTAIRQALEAAGLTARRDPVPV